MKHVNYWKGGYAGTNNDLTSEQIIKLYPNPNNGILFMDISSGQDHELTITVINQIGVVVKEEKISTCKNSNTQLDLNNISAGIYFINIKGDIINVTRKIVVQK